MNQLSVAVGFGIVSAAVVALAAVGLTLQVGVTNFVNFAYGDFMSFGAYVAYSLNSHGVTLALAAVGGGIATAALGVAADRWIFQPFIQRRARLLVLLIVTVGLSFIVQNAIIVIWGPSPNRYTLPAQHALTVGPFIFTPVNLITIGVAALLLVALHGTLKYTTFGKTLRATSSNADLAQSCGINTSQLVRATWALSGFFAGLAGVGLVLEVNAVSPTVGYNELFIVFAAVILGGLGKPYGAMLGALVMGFVTEISGVYLGGSYNLVIAFAVLIGVLLLRPEGIFRAQGKTS